MQCLSNGSVSRTPGTLYFLVVVHLFAIRRSWYFRSEVFKSRVVGILFAELIQHKVKNR